MVGDNKNMKAYEQACNTIRHYSNLSFTTRTISIVQGLVLLGTWVVANNNTNCSKVVFIFISSFGVVFTLLLFFFHKGYWDALDFLYGYVSKIENNLFDLGFKPHYEYNKIHIKKYKGIWRRTLIIYAPFTLIGVLFVVLLIISIYK